MGIFSSIFGGDAEISAAKKQIKESKAAQTDSLGYVQPYATAGTNSLKAYLDSIGAGDSAAGIAGFENSPEYKLNYQTALDEGTKGVTDAAQATGTYNSGRTLKALQDRAQTTSRGFFSDYLKGLSGVADTGFRASGLQSDIRNRGSQNINQGIQAKADAKTSQYAGFDNLLSGGLKFLGGGGLNSFLPAPKTIY